MTYVCYSYQNVAAPVFSGKTIDKDFNNIIFLLTNKIFPAFAPVFKSGRHYYCFFNIHGVYNDWLLAAMAFVLIDFKFIKFKVYLFPLML